MDRSSLKREYRQAGRPMGVYGITDTVNNTIYIGYGTDVQARLNRHRAELKFGNHRTRKLQEAWNESGEPAFLFEVLDVLDPEKDSEADPGEELRTLAEMWIQKMEKAGNSVEGFLFR